MRDGCLLGCVAKKEGGDKLRNSRSKFPLPNVQVKPVQVATQPSAQIILGCVRWYLSYPRFVPPSRRDGERTGMGYAPRNDISLGTGIGNRNRQTLPTLPKAN